MKGKLGRVVREISPLTHYYKYSLLFHFETYLFPTRVNESLKGSIYNVINKTNQQKRQERHWFYRFFMDETSDRVYFHLFKLETSPQVNSCNISEM